MSYNSLKEKLINFIKQGYFLLKLFPPSHNQSLIINEDNNEKVNEWIKNIIDCLYFEGEELSSFKIKNLGLLEKSNPYSVYPIISPKSEHLIKNVINELIKIAEKIEFKRDNKRIIILTIDDIDNFKKILNDDEKIDSKYFFSAFLEDDVENTFLEILNEPYKENDSGAEMRDLYTNNIKIDGKRIHTAIMFKGRGIKKSLKISNCGINGDQLLKLAKNTTAQLFIIQHVNKIESEVIESLKHHLTAFSQVDNIMICPIDGKDTARILASAGKDLEGLINKKGR